MPASSGECGLNREGCLWPGYRGGWEWGGLAAAEARGDRRTETDEEIEDNVILPGSLSAATHRKLTARPHPRRCNCDISGTA
jgi:hypothetical protein